MLAQISVKTGDENPVIVQSLRREFCDLLRLVLNSLRRMLTVCRHLIALLSAAHVLSLAHGQALSTDVEVVLVPNVGASFQEVDLYNTYADPVIACTYNLPSSASPPATVRMQQVTSTSFEIRLQQFENSNVVTPGDVHCLVVDAGVHLIGGSLEIEAHKVTSDSTSGDVPGWGSATTERVDGTFGHTYTNLVLLGQVMSFNDVRASVFWTNNCNNRGTPPTDTRACVGKHIGMIDSSRLDETLGYIAIEAGTGAINDVRYAFARGADSPRGVGDSPPYSYAVTGDFDVGVLTQAAEDGGNGGWAVLFGNDPLPNNSIQLAIDEEVFEGDMSRRHTTENVFYGVFENNQTADLTVTKDVSVASDNAVQYYFTGSDVIYTIDVTNDGSAPLDEDTVFLVDSLPAETEFFNGDHDGPGSGVIGFTETDSGLTFDPLSDVGYSTAAAKPTSFADCSYNPDPGYDANVRHICFNPKGRARDGTLYPNSAFSFSFRVRIS